MAFPRFGEIGLTADTGGACCDGNRCTEVLSSAACPSPKRFLPKCKCHTRTCLTNEFRAGPCCRKLDRQLNQECDDLQARQGTECFSDVDRATCVGSDGTFGVWMEDQGYTEQCCEQFPTYISETGAKRCPVRSDLGRCCKGNPRKCCDGYTEQDCNERGGEWEQGVECGDYTVSPRHTYDCPAIGACCDNGLCSEKTRDACLGEFHPGKRCNEVDCTFVPPPDGPGCRGAQTNFGYPAKGLKWSLEPCALIRMSPAIRNRRQWPAVGPDRDSEWESGFFEPVSMHPVRAVETNQSADFEEPCRYHFGGIVLGADGFFAPAVLSRPIYGDDSSIELSIGSPVRQRKPDEDGVAEYGMFHFAATYHTPFWTEAHMHSRKSRCEIAR